MSALEKRSLVWLSGVRRVGKTTLCASFGEAVRLDCELPSARLQLEDPEVFWRSIAKKGTKLVVLDEVHRLPNPSEVLKIAADHFPQVKVVATGLSVTHVAQIIRPFNSGSTTEIKSQPKVFGFDTGFVNWFRGISSLAAEAQGNMLEHLVLCELNSFLNSGSIYYWRNKQKNKIDFVIKPGRGNSIDTIECKSKLKKFDPNAVLAFRKKHPLGKNIVVTLDAAEPQTIGKAGVEFTSIGVEYLGSFLKTGK